MPDLNTVPASPHNLNRSRRTSSNQMPPPSLDILPSNQETVNHPRRASNNSLPSPHFASASISHAHPPPTVAGASSSVVSGPGPMRHPRPLTAADLHIQLEKEQEAVVNRLTRELQLLRAAHNASTVSNASSTSAGNQAPEQAPGDTGLLSGAGFSIPSSTGRRHNRTSSNTSTRSLAATVGSTGISSPAIPIRPIPIPMSRQNSSASHRSFAGSSPAVDPLTSSGYFHPSQRSSHMSAGSFAGSSLGHTLGPQAHSHEQQPLSPGLLPGTNRYEEAVLHREQLEVALQENEVLKKRIRELERMVRERRRSESVSTTTSTGTGAPTAAAPGAGVAVAGRRVERPGPDRERSMTTASASGHSIAGSVGVGVPDEEVKVGESASNAGLSSQSEGGN